MTASMIVLDLSPMLVNRTAMFDVCREANAALADHISRHQYYGEIFPGFPEPVVGNHLRSKLAEWLSIASLGRPAIREKTTHNARREPGTRKVFLDPLYTVFSDLEEEDVVMILDMSTVTHPWWHAEAVATLYEAAFDRLGHVQPKLLAISSNSADTFVANYGYPRRPIEVVPLYVPNHLNQPIGAAPQRFHDGPYFLFVGSLEARKNVTGAILAFAQSGLADQGYSLLIAGGEAHGAKDIESLARRTRNVVLCGFVDNDELSALYANACGFIYPSYLEGFGVPLLEAMQYGTPAVASRTGACPEVGGDLVAYCDPDDHAAFAAEIVAIAHMPAKERQAWAEKSRQRVKDHFSLDAFRRNIIRAVVGL